MKAKCFLLGFMFLTLIAFSTTARAADYKLGFEKDQEIIWVCNVCNEDEMEDCFGKEWDEKNSDWHNMEQGARAKWEIKDTDDGVDPGDGNDCFEIEYDAWHWTTSDKWGDEDDEDQKEYKYEDPEDYPEHKPASAWYWVPYPADKYLKDVDFDKDVKIEGLTFTVDIEEDEYGAEEDLKYTGTYNDRGIMSNLRIFNQKDELIAEMSMEGFIPGYELPILLGITAVFTIGIIYVTMKKRK